MATTTVTLEPAKPDAILSRLDGVRRGRTGWIAKCPAHDDSTPSLDVRIADDGKLLLYCRARCRTEEILAALGLSWRDLFPPRPAGPERRSPPRLGSPLDQARADVLAEARRQPWYRDDIVLTYQTADVIRRRRRAVAVARDAATRAGDCEKSWSLLEAAAHLETEAEAIETLLEAALA